MIHVIALITVQPGKRDEVLAAFHDIVPVVRAEDGCIEYGPTIDAMNAPDIQTACGPDTFVVIEKWSSPETLEAHGKSAHMLAYGKNVGHMIEQRIIHILEPA